MSDHEVEAKYISNNGMIRTLSQMHELPISHHKLERLSGMEVGEWLMIDCNKTEIDRVQRIE